MVEGDLCNSSVTSKSKNLPPVLISSEFSYGYLITSNLIVVMRKVMYVMGLVSSYIPIYTLLPIRLFA